MRKICIVTGTRAEYGLLSRLMKLIDNDSELTLQIIATNMHLSSEFGLTYKDIEADGFTINKKVHMLISSDTANATAKSIGIATIGFADAFEELAPDLLLVLGDRSEILAAVTAATFFKIPIAHIHGGEITEGAYDDVIRHAISKMSHIHFTSTDENRQRVIQLGEEPSKVHNMGALGVDNIKHIQLLSKIELEKNLNFQFGEKSVLVTYHPVTLEQNSAEEQMRSILNALSSIDDLKIIFTLPNSDTGGRVIIELIHDYIKSNKANTIAFASLGQLRYLSSLQFISAVVGNSSSGIVEAPSFGIPTLNIGNRQKGRLKSNTIIDCEPNYEDIVENLEQILTPNFINSCKNKPNPYDKANTANEILSIIKTISLENIIIKKFHDL